MNKEYLNEAGSTRNFWQVNILLCLRARLGTTKKNGQGKVVMKFILPMPPGINKTYGVTSAGNHHMYKHKVVRDWEETAGWEVKRQNSFHRAVFSGPVQVGIKWFYKRDRDIDSGIKVLFDLFERQGIYRNDRQIRKVTYIDIEQDKNNPRVEVEISEMED